MHLVGTIQQSSCTATTSVTTARRRAVLVCAHRGDRRGTHMECVRQSTWNMLACQHQGNFGCVLSYQHVMSTASSTDMLFDFGTANTIPIVVGGLGVWPFPVAAGAAVPEAPPVDDILWASVYSIS
jgi:hypothetical protein